MITLWGLKASDDVNISQQRVNKKSGFYNIFIIYGSTTRNTKLHTDELRRFSLYKPGVVTNKPFLTKSRLM
jgi:hypothetical protein